MSQMKVSRALRIAAVMAVMVLVPVSVSTAGGSDDPVEIAIEHVQENPSAFGVARAGVAELAVESAYPSSHTGVTHVNLNQRHDGREVFGAYVTVNVAPDGGIVFAGGSLEPGLRVASGGPVALGPARAVRAAARGLGLEEPADLIVLRPAQGRAHETLLSGGGISEEPIPVRLGWQPTPAGLRLAWQLVIDDATDVHLWNATVDARSGRLLHVDDWTDDHDQELEELAHRLHRGAGAATGLTGTAGGSADPRTTNPVEDGSSYNVFALPIESPADGRPRSVVTEPADGTASPYGWHDVSGTPTPDYTTTRGNNVHAYTDRDASNVPDPGSEPDGGPTLTFDHPMDLDEHAYTYTDAAVTNLFYWCNVIHDVMYLYGFDEPAGNFQVNNYGRGGTGGDDVRCEAMDGGGHNNANFSTPAQDGGRPRMQMYLWPGLQFGLPNAVTVGSGPAAGTYLAHYARFTPAATTDGIEGPIVTAFPGGVPALNSGCLPYVLGIPEDAIVLVDASPVCNYRTQVANAEAAGAAAVIIAHSGTGSPPFISGSMSPPAGIPAVVVSQADGVAIRAGLPATGKVHRNTARPPIRDGDLEAGIITHEYSHGVSNRLTGGPTVNCLTGDERMGEGWSDWHAIALLLDPELDDPEQARGMGPYALFQPDRQGNGIRPRPYSRNMQIQPATYDGIKSSGWIGGATLSTPHGVGHVWAAFLWDMTWDLIDRHGFNPNIYEPWDTGGNNLAYQLVNDGMKLQGCGPGFVVGRDAIIAADDVLTGGENACILWGSFARRGLGYSAIQGSTNRNDNTEAFDTHPDCRRDFLNPYTAYGGLNDLAAGALEELSFTVPGSEEEDQDVLASNSPFSRRVSCSTLAVPSEGSNITPRERPIATESPTGLSRSEDGVYTYPWQTLEDWAGTCRELVLTLDEGTQHRAFFRFVA